MRRIFPYPLLAISLILMWMLLTSFTPGQFLLGLGVAIICSFAMARLKPDKVHIRSWITIPKLFFIVLFDITMSNLAVARIILTPSRSKGKSGFMIITLDMADRTGIAVLGCILTATPGTAWIAYDSKSNELLLHVLYLDNEDKWRDLVKERYEKMLMEIFE